MNSIRILVFAFLLVVAFNSATAQNPTFELAFGGAGMEFGVKILAADDGYVVLGNVLDPSGSSSIYLLKIGLPGNVIWKKTFSNISMHASGGIRTKDKGFAIIGGSANGLAGLPIILKTDADGNILWCQTITQSAEDFLNTIAETADGGLLAAGSTRQPGTLSNNGWVTKTDHSGALSWTKTIDIDGSHDEFVRDNLLLSDSGSIMLAAAVSPTSAFAGLCLIRTDENADIQWIKGFLGIDKNALMYPTFISTADHGYLITGTYQDTSGKSDVFLLKADSSGTQQWANTYHLAINSVAAQVIAAPGGGYVIVGTTGISSVNRSGFILKTANNGSVEWINLIGTHNVAHTSTIVQGIDNGYALSGDITGTSLGLLDVLLMKTNDAGTGACNTAPGSATASAVTLPTFQPTATATTGGTGGSFVPVVDSGGSAILICANSVTEPVFTTELKLSPNPSDGLFTIESNSPDFDVIVTNIQGQRVLASHASGGRTDIDLRNQSYGIYFYTIYHKSQMVKHGKLLIE